MGFYLFFSSCLQKEVKLLSVANYGGGGGIRTHVRQKGENGFQDRHHKPLGHPST